MLVADASWPELFRGVLDIEIPALRPSGPSDVGVFRFPDDLCEISDAYLLCGYTLM